MVGACCAERSFRSVIRSLRVNVVTRRVLPARFVKNVQDQNPGKSPLVGEKPDRKVRMLRRVLF